MITLQSFGTSVPAGTRSRLMGALELLQEALDYTAIAHAPR